MPLPRPLMGINLCHQLPQEPCELARAPNAWVLADACSHGTRAQANMQTTPRTSYYYQTLFASAQLEAGVDGWLTF